MKYFWLCEKCLKSFMIPRGGTIIGQSYRGRTQPLFLHECKCGNSILLSRRMQIEL